MIGTRKLGIAISAAAVAGAALTGALWAGTAHAQAASSLSLTSAVLGPSQNNQAGSQTAVLTFSVTCPAFDTGVINVTASQSGTGTGHTGTFFCTGSAQSVTVDAGGSTGYAVGQVYVGAALDIGPTSNPGTTGPFGPTAGTVEIVAIQ